MSRHGHIVDGLRNPDGVLGDGGEGTVVTRSINLLIDSHVPLVSIRSTQFRIIGIHVARYIIFSPDVPGGIVGIRVRIANDPRINQDWDYLQASNNFRFMTTKPSNVGLDRGIYSSPFDAFTNYMNILGDFMSRVNSLYPESIDNDELNALLTTIRNQGDEIQRKDLEITRLQAKVEKMQAEEDKLHAKLDKVIEAPKKAAAKKAAPKTKKAEK